MKMTLLVKMGSFRLLLSKFIGLHCATSYYVMNVTSAVASSMDYRLKFHIDGRTSIILIHLFLHGIVLATVLP